MNAKVRKSANLLLRLAIMVLTMVFLYRQLFAKTGAEQWIDMIGPLLLPGRARNLFLFALALLTLNLMLESLKWQLIIQPLEQVPFVNALAAVLAGISVSLFLPNRIGDYLGRIFVLRKANPAEAVLLTVIGSFSQLIVIGIAGAIALLILLPRMQFLQFLPEPFGFWSVLLMSILAIGAGILLYFNLPLLRRVFSGRKGWVFRIEQLLGVYELLSNQRLFLLLLISAARYLVFSTQFYLLILAFGQPVPYLTALTLISMIYLLMTLIPTIAISELGIRGSVTVAVFALYFGADVAQTGMVVLAASSMLWLINLAFPALLGAFAVNRLRFIRTDD
ncbi:MAG: flippase-like domain-containing protein [Bacteroidia bacterium]|nr:flippase-like domain-containing protein [Bacteroidia bacterium]